MKNKEFEKLMKQNRYTQTKLAALVGVSVPTVNRWLSGRYYPTYANMQILAEALHADIDLLFEIFAKE
jgi:transcriptional regulator with XRE-family HTH domain